jgi:hypothetical protein
MNILIAGLGRSGSTVLFNIVKELLLYKYDDIYAVHERSYKKFHEKEINILKEHGSKHKEWADIILTTRRDMRDILSSFKQFHSSYDDTPTSNWVELFIQWHTEVVDDSNYEFIYEDYMEDAEIIIHDIANILEVEEYNVDNIIQTIDNLKKIKVKGTYMNFDKKTLMHGGHITKNNGIVGAYKKHLTPEEIKVVETVAYDWLKKYGYEI